jgi:hypothetical protein
MYGCLYKSDFALLLFTISSLPSDSVSFLLHQITDDVLSVDRRHVTRQLTKVQFSALSSVTRWRILRWNDMVIFFSSLHSFSLLRALQEPSISHSFCFWFIQHHCRWVMAFFSPKRSSCSLKLTTHCLLPPLTLNLLSWRIFWAPNNASKWQIGFNLAFKGLIMRATIPPFLHTSYWLTQGQFCLFTFSL